jgi:Tfp pilus assembly protein PilF
LCKETALLFPALVLLHGLLLGTNARRVAAALKQAAPYFVIAAIYIAIRIQVMGAFSHTLTQLSPATLLLTLPSVALFYVRMLFFPTRLSPFYDTPYVTKASFNSFVLPLLALIAIAALLAWWIRGLRRLNGDRESRARQAVFFLIWAILFLIPAFNLSALDPGEIAHDRYLYLPSIGFCALAGIALKQLAEKLHLAPPIRTFAVAGLGIILCTATIAQSVFWKDDLNLYKRGASIAPNNINAQNNLGNVYLETGDFEHGIAAHQKILRLNPRFVDSYFNLGLAYYNLGDMTQAQSYLQQAIALRPSAQTYFYLGLAQFKKGERTQAEQCLQIAAQLEPGRPDFHAALGVLYETEGKLPLALQELEKALSLNPQNTSVRNEVAKIQRQMGQAP